MRSETDGNLSALDAHLASEDAYLRSLPVCDFCGEPIQCDRDTGEHYYYLVNGENICPDCLRDMIVYLD